MLKIGIYVLNSNAKKAYKNESFNIRINAGITIVKDILEDKGYQVDFISSSSVQKYDIILISITSDCDWWHFISERVKWQKGNYQVIVGGQGVLNVLPFLMYVDYFVLGRAEGVIDKLVDAINYNQPFEHKSVISSKTFIIEKKYYINQVSEIYPKEVTLENGQKYKEDIIGCNHKCLFCSYSWHRKFFEQKSFAYSGLWNGGEDRERAIIDIAKGEKVNLNKLRTTAIDGLSEKLRFAVNKKITRQMLQNFIYKLATCEKPHQVKFYNIIGYPDETEEDYFEFVEDIQAVDAKLEKSEKQTSILLHSTPFRPMPATPMACKPFAYKNFRSYIANNIGKNYKGNIFYQGNAIWAVESMATESLATVMQSAIILRGTEKDTENIIKIASSKKFKSASSKVKQLTLEKYFDINKLFSEYTAENLPTRYLQTYAKVKEMW